MTRKKPDIANYIQTQKYATTGEAQVRIEQLNLDQLRTDGGIRCRIETAQYHVKIADYAEEMKDETRRKNFPPVRARYDEREGCYWLTDGFLRLEATRKAGFKTIEAEVRPGDRRQAILDAVGANAEHGWPRSNAEKHEAVLRLLNDKEWKKWSSHKEKPECIWQRLLDGRGTSGTQWEALYNEAFAQTHKASRAGGGGANP